MAKICNGEFVRFHEDWNVTKLMIDSRIAYGIKGGVFFCIVTNTNDGHKYIDQAYSRGIRQFVISTKYISFKNYENCNFLLVKDAVSALQAIATYHRKKFHLPSIGITGSNGKTIVKEWLFHLLHKKLPIIKSPKSYNSQIGVPLSVWEINEWHKLGIFEAGIAGRDEMQNLESIIQPTVGIFTNIGMAHSAGFDNQSQKIIEKSRLFRSCEKVIYCKDHHDIDVHLNQAIDAERLFPWSFHGKGFINAFFQTHSLHIRWKQNEKVIKVPKTDKVFFENLMHCLSTIIGLGFDISDIVDDVQSLPTINMRLDKKEGRNNCTIINDAYNNDITGIEVALDFLIQQNKGKAKTAILSDLYQTGMSKDSLYGKLSDILCEKGITKVIGIGEAINILAQSNHFDFYPFESTEDLLKSNLRFKNEIILIKGSRQFHFEKIAQSLEQKIHRTIFEIDLDALTHNLNIYRSFLKPETKVMVMVKAFGYGAGAKEIAEHMQYNQVDYLGVAYTDEGVDLREQGIFLPIMVMNPTVDSFDLLAAYNLEPEIYSLSLLRSFTNYFRQRDSTPAIHLKIETGMNRLGIKVRELDELVEIIGSENISIKGIMSHLAASDSPKHEFYTKSQFEKFEVAMKNLTNNLRLNLTRHILNSTGIINYPEKQYDMVRLGIGLYGFDTSNRIANQLQNICTLRTFITQIKTVDKGEFIGYGGSYEATKDMLIGIIPVGYADGFSRAFSNGVGKVSVNQRHAPTIGKICMDMTMIDLSNADAREGDEVIVYGKDINISEQARKIDTIPYELISAVSSRVKRLYYSS
ncbi:MAG TPA: bifunctional UDP-N-acetylmuramoyl-tripeptide:D-alanyl-D-alanine ligase/alanine racemase [Cyclobacteriaceae bacterium]